MKSILNTDIMNLSESLINGELTEKHNYIIDNIIIKRENLDYLVQELENLNLIIDIIDKSKNDKILNAYKDDYNSSEVNIVATIDRLNIIIDIFAINVSLANHYFKKMKPLVSKQEEVSLQLVTKSIGLDGKIQEQQSFKKASDFSKIKKEFYPYLDTDQLFRQFLESSSPILIAAGEPGIGKSKLISLFFKYILNNSEDHLESFGLDIDFQMFSANVIKNTDFLSNDSLWVEFESSKSVALILDDLDIQLKRSESISSDLDVIQNKFISQLLSFSDGILKKDNNMKIIITTNESVEDIDKALKRVGRVFDILQLRALTNKEAKNIWMEDSLPEEEFNKIFKDKDKINNSSLHEEMSKLKNEILFKRKYKPYALDKNISILQNRRDEKDSQVGFKI